MSILDPLKGFGGTFGTMFRGVVTADYPVNPAPVSPRYRMRHRLNRHPDGLEKCIGCALCAAACPADAIFVEASENTDERRFSPGERYASTYEINMLRCIFCGYCEDACPTEAIVLGDNYELSFTDRSQAIYTREMLLDPVPQGAEPTPREVEPGEFDRSIPVMADPK